MDIEQNKQSREALKGYFVPNAIPTAAQFALLIDSVLNQRSDGLVKPAAGPLSIEATGPGTGLRPVLDFYENMSNAQPSFSLALRPGANNTRQALTVLGEANTALLSIDRTSGNIGIGTADPKAKLEVNGSAVISGNIGVGTQTPRAKLEVVGGAFMPAEGNTTTAGIAFPPGRTGDQAYIRWYTRSDEDTTLEIGNSNDAGDHISLMPSGNVGIGTPTPRAKLEVNGAARVGDLAMGPWPSNQGYVFLGSATQNQGDESNYGLLFGTTNDLGSTFLNASTQIVFRIRNADQMRLTSEGNFGIGTHTPRAKLEVVGSVRVGDLAMGPWPNRSGYVFLGSATQNQVAPENYGLLFGTSNDVGSTFLNGSTQIAFRIRNADQMRLTSDGKFGIGTNTPQAKLHVMGDAVVTGNLTVLQQSDWTNASLDNGWNNWGDVYAPAGYMKDSLGFVHLRGLVRSGAPKVPIFTLPLGSRPQFRYLHCISSSGDPQGRVDITANGEVLHLGGSNGWVSLDGIIFRAVPISFRGVTGTVTILNTSILNPGP
jgi:hypothetical protein